MDRVRRNRSILAIAIANFHCGPEKSLRFPASVGNGQVSLIFGVPNFWRFFAPRPLSIQGTSGGEKAQKLGTPKIRDTWPFPDLLNKETLRFKGANFHSDLILRAKVALSAEFPCDLPRAMENRCDGDL